MNSGSANLDWNDHRIGFIGFPRRGSGEVMSSDPAVAPG